MIFVTRSAKPAVLAKNEAKWLSKLKTATTNRQRRLAGNKYRHRAILAALKAMFHGKCAYCESCITHVQYPHIEHFHPRNGPTGDPNLTFDWNNLLLACGVCNGPAYKSDKFPDAAHGGPLVNPCADGPDDHLEFVYDPVAKLASVVGKTARGRTTEVVLGLNRSELRVYRSRQIAKLAVLAKLAITNADAATLLHEAKQPQAEYSRFASLF